MVSLLNHRKSPGYVIADSLPEHKCDKKITHLIMEDFFKHRGINKFLGDIDWPEAIDHLRDLELAFKNLLPPNEKHLRDIVTRRKEKGKRTFVLNFMGYPTFIEEIFHSKKEGAGLAVALPDINMHRSPSDELKNILRKKKFCEQIEGDVLNGQTWRKIRDWLEKQKGPDKKFHLILSRPGGGCLV